MKKIILVFLLLILFFTGLYFVKNPETEIMNHETRTNTKGEYITLSNGVTHYEIAGPDTAETVVLVHGFSVPYYIWDNTFDTLVNAGYRVLRYDLFGRGYSDRPNVEYNETLYEKQLLELIEKLQVKTPVHLAGLSFGGPVTAYFTQQHPELVMDLILLDPVTEPFEKRLMPEFVSLYYTKVAKAASMAEGQYSDFYHPENFPGWADKYREQMRYKGFLHALQSTRYHFNSDPHNLFQEIEKLKKPVLVIWGKEDTTTPFSASEALIEILHPEFVAVEEAGHLPHLEKPNVVHTAFLNFLKAR